MPSKIQKRARVAMTEKVTSVAGMGHLVGASHVHSESGEILTKSSSKVYFDKATDEVDLYEDADQQSVKKNQFEFSAGADSILNRAVEVIGEPIDAMRWLGTPVRALDYATPISLSHDANGFDRVLTVLGRMEHGVL